MLGGAHAYVTLKNSGVRTYQAARKDCRGTRREDRPEYRAARPYHQQSANRSDALIRSFPIQSLPGTTPPSSATLAPTHNPPTSIHLSLRRYPFSSIWSRSCASAPRTPGMSSPISSRALLTRLGTHLPLLALVRPGRVRYLSSGGFQIKHAWRPERACKRPSEGRMRCRGLCRQCPCTGRHPLAEAALSHDTSQECGCT